MRFSLAVAASLDLTYFVRAPWCISVRMGLESWMTSVSDSVTVLSSWRKGPGDGTPPSTNGDVTTSTGSPTRAAVATNASVQTAAAAPQPSTCEATATAAPVAATTSAEHDVPAVAEAAPGTTTVAAPSDGMLSRAAYLIPSGVGSVIRAMRTRTLRAQMCVCVCVRATRCSHDPCDARSRHWNWQRGSR